MGIMEKIANAKKSNWVSEGIPEAEIKTTVELAKISGRIERCRLDLGMTQAQFAEYMGVSQGMVSKWESREYNFTIRALNEVCNKLGLTLSLCMEKPCSKKDYPIIEWNEERFEKKRKNKKKNIENVWVRNLSGREAMVKWS